MIMPETQRELSNMLIDAAEVAVTRFAEANGMVKPFLNERQAKKQYGGDLKKWEEAGLIRCQQDGPGCNKRYSRLELEALSKASNYCRLKTIK